MEDIRWDRVFQRNIDPHYYNRRQVLWPATPLADLSIPDTVTGIGA
jgi:hypothetical protein